MYQIVNDYYGNLSSREKKNLSIKIGIILETYSKLKDLLIHDIRTCINYLRGKWSTASLDRSIIINIDIFTDVLDVSSIVYEYFRQYFDLNIIFNKGVTHISLHH